MKAYIFAAAVLAAGCSAGIKVDDIRISQYKDGKDCAVSLTFDDGMKEHYTIVAKELEERDWRGTFWLCCDWIHDDPLADTTHITWAEALEMHQNGHEMSNHSWSHQDLTKLSASKVEKEISKNDDAILKHLGVKPVTFCFPYNNYNDEVVEIAMKGKVGARLDQFWLGGQHSDEAYLRQQIDSAICNKMWISGMTHGINYGYDCYEDASDFTKFLDYLKSKEDKIWVGTFKDVAIYRAVAEATTLEFKNHGKKVTVTPKTSLDPGLYQTILTLEVPAEDGVDKIVQDGKHLESFRKNGKTYIYFNPFGGEIDIYL